ncbi:MAG TPA: hypothetical protein ENJ37_10315 [Deltaproteobacteria bacterium]|nr:hypothetical protein [Deltaproteobacteria bacterium]
MAAPTYPWNTISASQTDADSPLDTTLMEAIRQNLIHLEEWLGDSYTAAKDHDHDGANSKLVATIADGIVTNAKLNGGPVSIYFPEVSINEAWSNWIDTKAARIFIPDGVGRLYALIRLKTADANWPAFARLRIGSTVGPAKQTSSTSYVDITLDITPSAGDKGRLVDLYLQLTNDQTSTAANLSWAHKAAYLTNDAAAQHLDFTTASYFSDQ